MRDTKTFIVFEVILTTATKNLLLCIFFGKIEEHLYDQLRVLIRVYVHKFELWSRSNNCWDTVSRWQSRTALSCAHTQATTIHHPG